MEQQNMLVPVSGAKGGKDIVRGRRPMSQEARHNISLAMQESAEKRRAFLERKKAYNKMYLEKKRQEKLAAKEAKLNEKMSRLQSDQPRPRLLAPPAPAQVPATVEGQHPVEVATLALLRALEDEREDLDQRIAFCKSMLGME